MTPLPLAHRRQASLSPSGIGRGVLLGFSLFLPAACSDKSSAVSAAPTRVETPVAPQSSPAPEVPNYTYEVVNVRPHDREAFTEGLVYLKGILLESTGLNGRSTLRKVDLQTGRVLQQVSLPSAYFGEGMTELDGKVFMLTWQNQKGFVYNLDSLQVEREFSYTGEGWGLTTDGHELIMSDGTNQIRFLDPATLKVTRTISVLSQGQPLKFINELEYIKGELYANIWQTQHIVRIDPATGKVLGLVDLTGLLSAAEYGRNTDVLNGIAYDTTGDRLFVTGKNWPKLFEIRLKPR